MQGAPDTHPALPTPGAGVRGPGKGLSPTLSVTLPIYMFMYIYIYRPCSILGTCCEVEALSLIVNNLMLSVLSVGQVTKVQGFWQVDSETHLSRDLRVRSPAPPRDSAAPPANCNKPNAPFPFF